jgi:uncharacterized protein YndB with AHSA1/START domain
MNAGVNQVGEIRHEIRIEARPEKIFAFLTRSELMVDWLAPRIEANPVPGGIFRISDFDGQWVEGTYVEIWLNRSVAFTWGGIEGLKIGQSNVKFTLHPFGSHTILRLQHWDLPSSVFEEHDRRWRSLGLPKLKAVIDGRKQAGTYLSDIATQRGSERWSIPSLR